MLINISKQHFSFNQNDLNCLMKQYLYKIVFNNLYETFGFDFNNYKYNNTINAPKYYDLFI